MPAKNNFIVDGIIGISENVGEKSRLGFFGGISRGSGANKYSILFDDYEISGSSTLLFLKPQLTIHLNRVDVVFSSKFGHIEQDFHYYEYQTGADGDSFEYEIDEDRVLDAFFIEPAFSIIQQVDNMRLVWSAAFLVNDGSVKEQGGTSSFNIGVSIQYLRKAK